MLTKKKVGLMGAGAAIGMLSLLLLAPMAQGATVSDQGAAIVVYPNILFVEGILDTRVRMTSLNAASQVSAHCYYVNANRHCTNTGAVCTSSADCREGEFYGSCLPGCIAINFDVVLTPNQPLGWNASDGLAGDEVPCLPGFLNQCGGPSNAGTSIPPVSESPFVGELKCFQSNPITRLPAPCDGTPSAPCRNDLVGDATVEYATDLFPVDVVDPARYNAVGLRTTDVNDGDNNLCLGGDSPSPGCDAVGGGAEYEPCAEVLILNHFFDDAWDPISDVDQSSTSLTLVPCTQDFRTATIPPVTAQFLVYNEFEQRFSTSRQVQCLLDSEISEIDTTQPSRSIFNAAVSGTVAGQTRIRGVNGGLLGSARMTLYDNLDLVFGSAGYNLNQQAEGGRDVITVP